MSQSPWMVDNNFIERHWRLLNYEAVYLHELAVGFAAERVTGVRLYSALAGPTSAEAYGAGLPMDMMDIRGTTNSACVSSSTHGPIVALPLFARGTCA